MFVQCCAWTTGRIGEFGERAQVPLHLAAAPLVLIAVVAVGWSVTTLGIGVVVLATFYFTGRRPRLAGGRRLRGVDRRGGREPVRAGRRVRRLERCRRDRCGWLSQPDLGRCGGSEDRAQPGEERTATLHRA